MSDSLRRASLLLQQRRYDLALGELERHLSENPESASTHALRSICLTELGEFPQAEEAARHAIELQPDYAFSFYALARALQARKDHRGAYSAIEAAIELDPDADDYWLQKASVQFALYRWKEAILSTDAALAIDAENTGALLLRSHALHALGRTAEAEAMSRAALEIDPDLAMGHFEQGWALLRLGQPRLAEERFLEALRIDADLVPAREGLKEAVRSRFAPYRWITGYRHWLRRFSPQVSVGIMLGAMLVVNSLPKMVPVDSAFRGPVMLVVIAYALFAYLTWIAGPLSNFFLRFHPHGRHALTSDERSGTYVLGAIFAGAALLATGWFTLPELYGAGIMTCLGLAMPGAAIFATAAGKQRQLMALITAGLLLMGPVSLVVVSNVEHIPVNSLLGNALLFGVKNYWLGVAASTWVSAGMSARD